MTTTEIDTINSELDAELEALLGESTRDEPADEAAEVHLEDIEATIRAEETKTELYESQDAERADAHFDEVEAKRNSKAATKAKRTTRVAAVGGSLEDWKEQLLNYDINQLKAASSLIAGNEDINTLINVIASMPQKVANKAGGLLAYLVGKTNSVDPYVSIAIAELIKRNYITNHDLTCRMMERGYTVGTARSQTSQIMSLFHHLKIAQRDNKYLTLQPNHPVVRKFAEAAT